jgi:hypothetical protein
VKCAGHECSDSGGDRFTVRRSVPVTLVRSVVIRQGSSAPVMSVVIGRVVGGSRCGPE